MDERLEELLAEWEERRLDGQPVAPEQLCTDPELLSELRQAIGKLGKADALLRPATGDCTTATAMIDARGRGEPRRVAPAIGASGIVGDATTGSQSSSTSLVVRLQARDPEGWRRFTQIYGPLVYSWARAARLPEADAADVGQEVFQAVALHIDEFRRDRPGDSLRGWIWTVTRNKIREHFRRRARRPEVGFGDHGLAELAAVANEPENGEETARLAQRALDLIRTDFETRTWQAFWRTAVDGERPVDVARELGLSPAAVYMARSRVLARLRQELGEFSR